MPHDNLLEIYDNRTGFWQWDTGQKLRVLDKTIDQVHFSNKDLTYAIVKEVYVDDDGVRVCDVPDVILKLSKPIVAYAYVMDVDANRTTCAVKFAVTGRPIPEDYTYEEDNRFKNLVDKIEAIEDILDSGASIKRFNSISDAEEWAAESHEAGALIAILSDTQWIAYIVNHDLSISRISGDNSDLITSIQELQELVGDSSVFEQISTAIGALKYDKEGSAAAVQGKLDEEIDRAKNEEVAITKAIQQLNNRADDLSGVIDTEKARAESVEGGLDDRLKAAEVAINEVRSKTMKPLTFIGAVTGTYDGSSEVEIDIPVIAGEPGYTPIKGVDYFDGYTPVKGVDYFDGEPGAPGKSAYEYAQEAGYTGTEEEFAGKLASDQGVASWNDLTDKPFGEVPGSGEVICDHELYDAGLGFSAGDFEIQNFSIVSGETYTVRTDDGNYAAVCKEFVMGEDAALYLGNLALIPDSPFENTGESFLYAESTAAKNLIAVMLFDANCGTSMTVIEGTPDSIIPLDPKYLPDTVGTVKSVNGITPDETGNVTLEIPNGEGSASSIPDEEMLELLAEMDVVQPLANSNNAIYVDKNDKVYVL